jgi:hypothetical protein
MPNILHSSCANTHVAHYAHNCYFSHAMISSSSYSSFAKATHARSRQHAHHIKSIHAKNVHVQNTKKKSASNVPFIAYHTLGASYVLSCKFGKVVATHVGSKRKNGKTCVWVLKTYVYNLNGPSSDWVPKTKA